MLMIVSCHFFVHGGVNATENATNANWWLSYFVWAFDVGVDCFVLISGYFLISSHNFKWRKVLKLWLPVLFWSVCLYIIVSSLGYIHFSKGDFLKTFAPVKLGAYWFVCAYVGMYILYPYLNMIADRLDKNEYRKFLFILLGFGSVYSFAASDPFGLHYGYAATWFIILYFLGGYIRKYVKASLPKKKVLVMYVGCVLVTFVAWCVAYLLLKFIGRSTEVSFFVFTHNSPFRMVTAVALFLLFKNWNPEAHLLKFAIKFFAPLTFGVYLIHDSNYIRPHLWKEWLHVPEVFGMSPVRYLLYYFACVVLVFTVSALLEKFRQVLFKRLFGL